jgi:hypothetical protein
MSFEEDSGTVGGSAMRIENIGVSQVPFKISTFEQIPADRNTQYSPASGSRGCLPICDSVNRANIKLPR